MKIEGTERFRAFIPTRSQGTVRNTIISGQKLTKILEDVHKKIKTSSRYSSQTAQQLPNQRQAKT